MWQTFNCQTNKLTLIGLRLTICLFTSNDQWTTKPIPSVHFINNEILIGKLFQLLSAAVFRTYSLKCMFKDQANVLKKVATKKRKPSDFFLNYQILFFSHFLIVIVACLSLLVVLNGLKDRTICTRHWWCLDRMYRYNHSSNEVGALSNT